MERHPNDIPILCRHQTQDVIILKSLPMEKLQEYDNYPLAHRAGLVHCLPEKVLSLDTATITDVNFFGLSPKSLVNVLGGYKRHLKQNTQ
jgi:hypothetical protein